MTASLIARCSRHHLKRMRIGELARLTALSPDTLRVYERRGLVRSSARSRGRFREYDASAVARVRWVQNALALGFTLAQLSGFTRDRAMGKPPCRKVRAAAEAKLRSVESELARLTRLRETLQQTIRVWDEQLEVAEGSRPLGLLDMLGSSEASAPTVRQHRFRSKSQSCA